MYIVDNYLLAIIFCFITMLCWGSWGNTQKLASKTWRYEYFYWDYVFGIVLCALFFAFTLGSHGENGRSFLTDLRQADFSSIGSALLGGIIFNASNILLSAAIAVCGMSVAFPIGVGLALVLGVFVNYFSVPKGDPVTLFGGVFLIVLAIVFNGIASSKVSEVSGQAVRKRGVLIAVCAGILMAFFYRFVAAAIDLENLESPAVGMMTPYSALFVFAIGIFISNFLFNSLLMRKPFTGVPVAYSQYFKGNMNTHLVGIFGGAIWALGTACSYIAAGTAGAAISYGLGQGATMVAALWGVFIWKEFKGGSKSTNLLIALMFVLFFLGLALIITSGGN